MEISVAAVLYLCAFLSVCVIWCFRSSKVIPEDFFDQLVGGFVLCLGAFVFIGLYITAAELVIFGLDDFIGYIVSTVHAGCVISAAITSTIWFLDKSIPFSTQKRASTLTLLSWIVILTILYIIEVYSLQMPGFFVFKNIYYTPQELYQTFATYFLQPVPSAICSTALLLLLA
eukprot:TRINITY_DN8917_c0_g1_i2.p1 TRINITY_DN8917_c0_g1~~TRINITY_DN8917_c0_g1_i2.p1  ORF type:complete len:173 (+),score=6.19 TRINITY_DN8917_c0_g1_i2:1-519(+)